MCCFYGFLNHPSSNQEDYFEKQEHNNPIVVGACHYGHNHYPLNAVDASYKIGSQPHNRINAVENDEEYGSAPTSCQIWWIIGLHPRPIA